MLKACPACRRPLERRPGEPQRDFDKRVTCNASCADTHRYRMLGNAVTVSVVEWIAGRIKAVAA